MGRKDKAGIYDPTVVAVPVWVLIELLEGRGREAIGVGDIVGAIGGIEVIGSEGVVDIVIAPD